jgi:predicted nucleic acid-binding protein
LSTKSIKRSKKSAPGDPNAGRPRHDIVVRFIYSPSGFIVGLVRLLQPPQHALITSAELIGEAADVLARPRLRVRHKLDDQAIAKALDQLYSGFPPPVTLPSSSTSIVPHDSKDDIVVLTAITGRADAICTLDAHLHEPSEKQFCGQHGIRILGDIELLTELNAP